MPEARLAAEHGAGRGGRRQPQLGDDALLADQVAEDAPRPDGDRAIIRRSTGMLPVLSSANGTGSGSSVRIRSWISRLSSTAGRVASSTR